MDQRDSGYEQFELSVHAGAYPSWDYAVAAKILDGYRAEWNAAQAADRQPPSMSDVLDVLEHLGVELAAANARYQRAPTPAAVGTLLEDVYSACAAYWTWMAYWAAQFRGNGLELAAEIEDLKLWKRYVGPTWTGLIQVLDDTPVEDLGTPGDMLRGGCGKRGEFGLDFVATHRIPACAGRGGRGVLHRPLRFPRRTELSLRAIVGGED
jgi:hypothetical protein